MKSSYELAMERLNKSSPTAKISAKQKAEIAELESRYKAKIAEREIALRGETAQAAAAGDFETVQESEKRLVIERQKLQAELEEKKEAVRGGKA